MKLFAFDKFAATVPALAGQHGLVTLIGIAELAGALGVILPRLTGIKPVLTTWAAIGLSVIMILATGFHLMRGEVSHAIMTVILLVLAAFIAYGYSAKRAQVFPRSYPRAAASPGPADRPVPAGNNRRTNAWPAFGKSSI
jgi:hypothetical protein